MSYVVTEITPLTSVSSVSSLSYLSALSPYPVYVPAVKPIILTSTESIVLSDPSPNSPYVTSLNVGFSTPQVGIYENLNASFTVHKRMIKYYYHKLLENWIYDDLSEVLSWLKITGGTASTISKIADHVHGSESKDSDADREKKIDYLRDHFLTKQFVQRILTEFVNRTVANWYDLYKYEYELKDVFEKKLIKKIKKAIGK